MRYITLFEIATDSEVIDCVENGDMLVFIIKKGDIRKALARKGEKIQEFSNIIKKKVKVIEYSDNPADFIKNALLPAKIDDNIRITERPDGKKIAIVAVNPKDKGIAIGKEGKRIDLVRYLVKRHYGIDHIIVQ